MNGLPVGFNVEILNNYINTNDENTLVKVLNDSGNLFEFVKCAINDENWRVSNDALFKNIVLNLEKTIAKGNLSLEKIDEISRLSEVILKNHTKVVINFENIQVDLEINDFLLEKLKRRVYFTDNKGVLEFHITDFNIDMLSHDVRINLARAFAIKDPCISEDIQKFNIDSKTSEGQIALIEIAKFAAQHNGKNVSKCIKNYRIDGGTEEGKKGLIEIAKLAVQNNGAGFFKYIRKYGFDANTEEGQDILIEIVKQHDVSNVSSFIQDYRIDAKSPKGQKALIEVSERVAQTNPRDISLFISLYKIDSPLDRLRIWTLAFQKTILENENLRGFAVNSINFSLPNQEPYSIYINLMQSLLTDEPKSLWTALNTLVKQKWPGISIDAEFEMISQLTNEHQRQFSFNWFTATILTLISKNIDEQQIQTLQELNFFEHVLSLRMPLMRNKIITILIDHILDSDNSMVLFKTLIQNRSHIKYSVLSGVILMKLGMDLPELEKLITKIESKQIKEGKREKHSIFDQYTYLHVLLEALYCMVCEANLSPDLKERVLMAILDLDSPKEISKGCIAIKNIGNFNSLHILNHWVPEEVPEINKFLEDGFQIIFKDILPFKAKIENFSEKFEKTFASDRVFASFKTYIAALNGLSSDEKKVLIELLTIYVEKVLDSNDAYKNWRYSGDENHLKTVYSITPSLRENWMMNDKIPLKTGLKDNSESSSQVFDFKGQLLDEFANNHISKENYPNLCHYLTTDKAEKGALSIPKEALKEKKQKIGFEIAAIALCSATNIDKQQNMLNKIDRMKWLPLEFRTQVQAWKTELMNSQIKVENRYKDWTVEFTDDPFDLFLCGTEVEGSCQNVNGVIGSSKCLLAYVTDGKNKLIEVKGTDNKIKARAIIRILLDSNRNPILFLEKIYPTLTSPQLTDAIIHLAKTQARRMGLPLLSRQVGEGEHYPHKAVSLGSKAPFEYVDACAGIKLEGRFTIENMHSIRISAAPKPRGSPIESDPML